MSRLSRFFLIAGLLVIMNFSQALASMNIDKDDGGFKRMLKVHGRGLVNIATFWWEFPETTVTEFRAHPKLGIITFIPKSVLHMGYRLFSGIYDVTLFTLMAPFTDDNRPITEHMGIPDYPWQKDVETLL